MEIFESDIEIFEFAIAREIEAYEFYCALAKRMINTEKQKLFEELAAEELEHKKALELELMKLGQVVIPMDTIECNEIEYEIEDDYAFEMEFKDILLLAIEKEHSAFKLYASLASKVEDNDSEELLLRLAEEEVKHKIRFELEYETLIKKGQQ